MADHRPQEVGEGGEGELGLRLDAQGFQDDHAAGPLARVAEEHALADAGLAAEKEGAAATLPRRIEQLLDAGALRCPP